MGNKYILFDTETTGNLEADKIIQVGAMIMDSKGSVEVLDEMCSTEQPISIEAMEVHNIVPSMLEGKPVYAETQFAKRLDELNTENNFLIAHNIPFDLEMIKREGFEQKINLICTLRCARHVFNDLPYHRLQYLRYALELYKEEEAEAQKHNITIKAHDAIGDVLVMKLFLKKLMERVKERFPDDNPILKMVQLTQQPVMIETFTFGKHKGKKLRDVYREDSGYLDWLLKNNDNEDMIYTINEILAGR